MKKIFIFITILTLICNPIIINLFSTLKFMDFSYPSSMIIVFLSSCAFLLGFPWILIAFASPVMVFHSIFAKKYRKHLVFICVIWIISWGSLPIAWKINSLKNHGLKNAIKQSQPIIKALENYKEENEEYPETLNQLLPKFIDKIPYTGLCGYPKFEYSKAGRTRFKKYELKINTPVGFMNWDVFIYWPEGNYPDIIYGGGTEKIMDWAYVHE